MKSFTFDVMLNKSAKLSITTLTCYAKLHPYDESLVTLHQKNKPTIPISEQDIEDILYGLSKILQHALDTKDILCPTIKEDIGYVWNQIQEGIYKEENHYDDKSGHRLWIGFKYFLWSLATDNLENTTCTWVYKKGSYIYFTVTPSYLWHFTEREENDSFVPYDQFIKNYKPIIKIRLAKKTVQKIIHWCTQVLAELDKRDRRPPLPADIEV